MVKISVDFNDSLDVLRDVKDVIQNQRAWGLFRKLARALFHSWWGETFDREGARRGHPRWKPLNPRYAAWKARQGKGSKILRFTGHLAGSPNILEETAMMLRWGTTNPYAVHHQEPKVAGRPPKREIIFVTKTDETEIEQFVSSFIRNVINTGFGVGDR